MLNVSNHSNASLITNNENETFKIILKTSIGTMCVLSILGASLIILTYIIYKDIRTVPRQLLLNLSIADLITALANLIGMMINFDKYLNPVKVPVEDQNPVIQYVCTAQAGLAQFFTNSSILWTIAIAFYMLLRVAIKKESIADKLIPVYYIISWGLPLGITIWFSIVGYLGYNPDTTPGWCVILGQATHNNVTKPLIYPVVIGYTGFVYIAFICLPIIYAIIRCHVKILLKRVNGQIRINLMSVSKMADLKMIFIPIIFIVIRVWSLIVDSFDYYADEKAKNKFESSLIGAILVLAKGLGDSSQGFANAILFIGFTKFIRVRLWRSMKSCTKCDFFKKKEFLMRENTSLISYCESNYNTLDAKSLN